MMREISPATGGPLQGAPNETLGQFLKSLVDATNQILKPEPAIRYMQLISPQDPNFEPPITQLPSSATTVGALRNNPTRRSRD